MAGIGPRHVLGEPADLVFGDAEHLGDIAEGGAGLEGIEAADDGGVLGAVAVEKEPHDIVFAIMREVDVDIRQLLQRHAVAIEEALEVQLKADGADVADAKGIANQRISGTATRDPADTERGAFLQQMPDGEEILFIADFGDDAEFLAELWLVLFGFGSVAISQSSMSELVKHGGRCGTICGRVAWKAQCFEVEGELAALDDVGYW